ncbi:MAG: Extracellular ligand-binding receptor [Candidatus Taylorbacteria bacterium]|nr:Extracellular ligand-binding receptor [Candidatus Taylorbacteria bacterium]
MKVNTNLITYIMKKIIFLFAVLLIVVVGCIAYSNRIVVVEPIVIGYIGPLTGPSAVLGMDAIKAVQIAVDEANMKGSVSSRPIKLVSEDDQYLTKNTVSAYHKLVDSDHVKIILVATYGGVFAIKDLAKKDGVIVVDPLDCNAQLADASNNIFCVATETESIGKSLAQRLIVEKKLSAGVMYSTKDIFMSLVTDSFRKTYEAAGGKTTVESFNYDDKDFKTQLSKIKAANPNALVLLGHDETGVIMKEARDIGIKAPFLATGTITSPGAQKAAQGYAEGTLFAYWDASPDNVLAKSFNNKFIASVGRSPILPLTTHPAYDVVNILTQKILPSISGNVDARKIKEGLLGIRSYAGITGEISMGSNGAAPISESIYKLVKGMPVKVD